MDNLHYKVFCPAVNNWVYGRVAIIRCSTGEHVGVRYARFDAAGRKTSIAPTAVSAETMCQRTPFHDANGVPIYDNDTFDGIDDLDDTTGYVTTIDGCWCVIDDDGGESYLNHYHDQIRITGNLYDPVLQ